MPNFFATILAAAEKPITAFIAADLVANKAQYIAKAKEIEPSAIVAVGATIVNTLSKESTSPFFSLLEAPLAHAIEASEPAIISALGGEDEAIYALLQHELAQLAS